MIRPTTRCVLFFALGLPVALIPTFLEGSQWTLWLVLLSASLLAVLVDFAMLLSAGFLKVEYSLPTHIHIGETEPFTVELDMQTYKRMVKFDCVTDLAEEFVEQPRAHFEVQPGEKHTVVVPLRPNCRGKHAVHHIWLRWYSPFGLLARTYKIRIDEAVPVIPNVRAVRDAALRIFMNNEFLSGLKVERYLGDGSEFESLREYLPGFDHRAIDWKASARHRKLLSREFQAERNHQVILGLDTGYLMREPLDGVPRLDHSINAGLLLSYVCLKSGDKVGMFGFDEKVRMFVEPQGGVHAIHSLQTHAAELDYTTSETNFTLGLASLSVRLRRRSLIVLITDFADTITAELMISNVQRLARRHVVLFVTMRDPLLTQLKENSIQDVQDLNRAVISDSFIRDRQVVQRRLTRMGVQCIDTAPGKISMEMVNRYLDIRRRELV